MGDCAHVYFFNSTVVQQNERKKRNQTKQNEPNKMERNNTSRKNKREN